MQVTQKKLFNKIDHQEVEHTANIENIIKENFTLLQSEDLSPIYTNQKSFYKKAIVMFYKDYIILKSYQTIMAIVRNFKIIYLNEDDDNYSQTTLKHVREFLYQFTNYKILSKKDIFEIKKGLK